MLKLVYKILEKTTIGSIVLKKNFFKFLFLTKAFRYVRPLNFENIWFFITERQPRLVKTIFQRFFK